MNRNITTKINWILDNLVPPILRDTKWFMCPIMWILFKDKTKLFMSFKYDLHKYSEDDFINIYENTKNVHLQRDTDLNKESLDFLFNNIIGNSFLDIACGSGYFCEQVYKKNICHRVVGADIITPESQRIEYFNVNIESTNFKDNEFDTVVSAHTLEHVVNINEAIKELRRIANKKLMVVLPKQRNYKFTFDLHIHFFPYEYDVLNLFKPLRQHKYSIQNIGGDWIYVEEY